MISSKILLIGLLICIAYVKVYIISFKNLDSFTFLILNFFLKKESESANCSYYADSSFSTIRYTT